MLDDVLLLERVHQWDEEIARLLDEVKREVSPEVVVPLPSHLSATALAQLRENPEEFAAARARPMPRQPSPAARFGTRFHAWVEARFGQQELFDPDDLPGRGDSDILDDADLKTLIRSFEAGPFATRVPHAVEAPFALTLGGQVVRGRIDAVYTDGDPDVGDTDGDTDQTRFLVVDWKTNRRHDADPLQLALYRLAWAELCGLPLDQVRAGFYYLRSGDLIVHDDLPDRLQLEEILAVSTAAPPGS